MDRITLHLHYILLCSSTQLSIQWNLSWEIFVASFLRRVFFVPPKKVLVFFSLFIFFSSLFASWSDLKWWRKYMKPYMLLLFILNLNSTCLADCCVCKLLFGSPSVSLISSHLATPSDPDVWWELCECVSECVCASSLYVSSSYFLVPSIL